VPPNPSEARERQRSDDGYRVPDNLIDFARTTLPSDQPLYLVSSAPSGFRQACLEKLATARLGRPVLWLGAVPVRPVRSDGHWTSRTAAVCRGERKPVASGQAVDPRPAHRPAAAGAIARLRRRRALPMVKAEATALDVGRPSASMTRLTRRVSSASRASPAIRQKRASSRIPGCCGSGFAQATLGRRRHFLTMGHRAHARHLLQEPAGARRRVRMVTGGRGAATLRVP
jgi:hypothetical protein